MDKSCISKEELGWPVGANVSITGFGEYEVSGVYHDKFGVWLKLDGWGNVDEWVSVEGVTLSKEECSD